MLNHIDLQGRFTRDPELKSTQSGITFASFTLANNEKDQTNFIDCIAWSKTAEFICKYFRKGSQAIVSGRLQVREWEDRDGKKRRSSAVVCDRVFFCESRRDDGGEGYSAGEPQYDDEMPF